MAADLRAQGIFDLAGRVALVTGGGTGIGLMIARGLLANGAKVYIAARRADVVNKAVDDFGSDGKMIPLELDVTSKESIRKAETLIRGEEGRLDILVNNAGQVGPRTAMFANPPDPSAAAVGSTLFDSESFGEWSDLFTVNVSSAFFVSTAFLGLLEKSSHSPSIVNVGSISGVMKLSQSHFAYNASKAALHHLTRMMATEFALKGFTTRVNAIAPGVFPSEMAGSGLKHIDEEVDEVSMGLRPLPIRRAGRDIDVTATVLSLVSQGGSYINGQVIVMDGGFIAVNPSVA